jgi:hypothetical protein
MLAARRLMIMFHEFIQLLLGFFSLNAVAFLDLSSQDLGVAGGHGQVVVGELTPSRLYLTF